MKNLRIYGEAPYSIAVIHGGPGAPGEMAPVARELASEWGVLEPLQSATSVECQLTEMKAVLAEYGDIPLTLIGFSWGAWLSFMFAARNSELMNKLILVGSGSYDEIYTPMVFDARFGRLNGEEQEEIKTLADILDDPYAEDKDIAFARLGRILSKADSYDPITLDTEIIDYQYEVFDGVWKDAARLRQSGELLRVAGNIKCPVVAIHGDYDPHPAEGVEKPLSLVLNRFRFVTLKDCGHMPWIERGARECFYRVLREELSFS